MIWLLEPVQAPEIEPVTLQQMKLHLREFDDITDNDDQITELIQGGREWVEDFTGRCLVDTTWRLTIDRRRDLASVLPGDRCTCGAFSWSDIDQIWLRKAPALAIVSVATVDADGDETTVDPSTYALSEADSAYPRLVSLSGSTWAASDRVRITFRAGYADRDVSPQQDATAVPVRLRQAVKLWVEAHYDRDKDEMERLLRAAADLARPLRVHVGFA